MTPDRLAFLVNVVARNAEIDARPFSGPWAASARAASDAVRELAEAVATARLEGVRAGLEAAGKACAVVAERWEHVPGNGWIAANECSTDVSLIDPTTIEGSP